jgi:hypothetical protein
LVAVKEWNCKFDHPVTAVAWNRVEKMVAFSSFRDAQPRLAFHDPKKPPGPSERIEDWENVWRVRPLECRANRYSITVLRKEKHSLVWVSIAG